MFIFVKHYEFMRKEFGEGLEKGVYSKIFSYYEFNGTACEMSYKQWAEYLICAKSTAQSIISGLIAKGYISAEARNDAGRNLCTAYTINESKLHQMLAENGLKAERDAAGKLQISESDAAEVLKTDRGIPEIGTPVPDSGRGIPEIGTPYTENRYTPIPENGTPTITENKTEIIDREGERASAPTREKRRADIEAMTLDELRAMARKRDETLLIYFGHEHNVPLTRAQHRELQQLSEKTGKGLQHYVNECSKSISLKRTKPSEAYTKIKFWILEDAEKREAEQTAGTERDAGAGTRPSTARSTANSRRESAQSSFTAADLESLVNLF